MKYGYKPLFYFLFIAIATLSSCELYNPPEPIPAYIHIDKINLSTTPLQGTSSNKITDAWVYIDGQLIGCFELPATFPVLYEGNYQVLIKAGIKVNGISAIRSPYPFFEAYSEVVNFQKGTTVTMTPTVTYTSNSNFVFMEDFESSGIAIDTSVGSDTALQRLFFPDPNVFEGNCGIAYLDKTNTFFECVSSASFTLPKDGKNIFLEFNYKSNHEFVVGVIAQPPFYLKTASLNYNPSNEWNKTYLYLTPAVSGSTNATQFKLFFGMINNTDSDSLALLLDNIKLIY